MRTPKIVLPPTPPYTIKEYEASPYWKKKSRALLDNKLVVCEMCKRKRWKYLPRKSKWKKLRFSVHHVSYDNIPNEKPEDLQVLCYICHHYSHTLLQLRGISEMFEKIAQIVEGYFHYDKDSFKRHNEESKRSKS